MAKLTKRLIAIYGAWVCVWFGIAGYGALFTGHGEYGVSSHLWLTISGVPASLLSWLVTPNGTVAGTVVAGLLGLVQWGAVAEVAARHGARRESRQIKHNQWVKLTGTTLRSAPAAYPRRWAAP